MKPVILLILAIALFIAVSAFAYAWFHPKAPQTASLTIGGNKMTYHVEIATTSAQQSLGLSNRPSLAGDAGMLFVFADEAPRYFWMNAMQIPLDALWIRDNQVVGLAPNLPDPAQNNGKIFQFSSGQNADRVLEINAGDIAKYGISVGDAIALQKP